MLCANVGRHLLTNYKLTIKKKHLAFCGQNIGYIWHFACQQTVWDATCFIQHLSMN